MPRLKVTARSNSPFGTIDDAQHKFVIKVGTGLKGETGERGLTGLKGDKGDAFVYADFTAPQLAGLKGVKGVKGDKGDKGEQGVAGTDGINATNETVKNQNTGLDTKIWIGTQSEYDAVVTKDSDTLYMVK